MSDAKKLPELTNEEIRLALATRTRNAKTDLDQKTETADVGEQPDAHDRYTRVRRCERLRLAAEAARVLAARLESWAQFEEAVSP